MSGMNLPTDGVASGVVTHANTIQAEAVGNILLIHVARIGDTLLTSAAIRIVARHYPQAKITFLGHPKRCAILENLPYLNEIGGISKKTALFLGWWDWLKRKLGFPVTFDLAIVWGHDAALAQYAIRVSQKCVFQKNDVLEKIAQQYPTKAIVVAQSDIHQTALSPWLAEVVERGLAVAPQDQHQYYVEYHVRNNEKEWAAQWLLKQGYPFNQNKRLIGLITRTHSSFPHRDWSFQHFMLLAQNIRAEFPDSFFLLFAEGVNQQQVEEFKDTLAPALVADHLSLRQLAALIDALDLYIGLDTGPSHIAAALNVPMVCLFHSARPGNLVLSPKSPEKVTMIDHPRGYQAKDFSVPMDEIKVDDVFTSARSLMKQMQFNKKNKQ